MSHKHLPIGEGELGYIFSYTNGTLFYPLNSAYGCLIEEGYPAKYKEIMSLKDARVKYKNIR